MGVQAGSQRGKEQILPKASGKRQACQYLDLGLVVARLGEEVSAIVPTCHSSHEARTPSASLAQGSRTLGSGAGGLDCGPPRVNDEQPGRGKREDSETQTAAPSLLCPLNVAGRFGQRELSSASSRPWLPRSAGRAVPSRLGFRPVLWGENTGQVRRAEGREGSEEGFVLRGHHSSLPVASRCPACGCCARCLADVGTERWGLPAVVSGAGIPGV